MTLVCMFQEATQMLLLELELFIWYPQSQFDVKQTRVVFVNQIASMITCLSSAGLLWNQSRSSNPHQANLLSPRPTLHQNSNLLLPSSLKTFQAPYKWTPCLRMKTLLWNRASAAHCHSSAPPRSSSLLTMASIPFWMALQTPLRCWSHIGRFIGLLWGCTMGTVWTAQMWGEDCLMLSYSKIQRRSVHS